MKNKIHEEHNRDNEQGKLSKTNPVRKLSFDPQKDVVTLLLMVVVGFFQGMVARAFYTPYSLLPCGITGISLLINYAFEDINSSLVLLVLNIPIIIVGLKNLDLKPMLFSIVGTFIFAAGLEYAPYIVEPYMDLLKMDEVLAALFGGMLFGVSYAPVVRRNATFGGMDIISLLISKKFSIPMGIFNILYNIVIMLALAIVKKQLELAVLSLAAMFVCNMSMDAVMKGLNRSVTVFIISEKWDDIAEAIFTEVNRGLTYIPAEGAYTGTQKKIVYCIVKTMELNKLRNVVMAHDPNALFSVTATSEVYGRGFGAVN